MASAPGTTLQFLWCDGCTLASTVLQPDLELRRICVHARCVVAYVWTCDARECRVAQLLSCLRQPCEPDCKH
jgi:hypothetical protein